MSLLIRCRAKVHRDCYDGRPTTHQFGSPEPGDVAEEHQWEKCVGEGGHFLDEHGSCERCPYAEPEMREDNTFDEKSIICDVCYLEIMPLTPSGRGRNEELSAAVGLYQANVRFLKTYANPEMLVSQAQRQADQARPGSPSHLSALKMKQLAEAEVERREAMG